MKKGPDHNSTGSAEIEALITRLERGQLRDGDAQSLARLLRLLLRLITLLQRKNASLARLNRSSPKVDGLKAVKIYADKCVYSLYRMFYVVRIPHVALFTDFGLEL